MAIINVTPDSFSDGGAMTNVDDALRRANTCIADGAAVLDIGGESTRPGSVRVSIEDECSRVVPVIEAIVRRFDIPISIDTSKSEVAERAIDAGAEIINDISALRFDPRMASVAAERKAGLVLMHSRGEFETMHSQPPVDDILKDVSVDFRRALASAKEAGVSDDCIVLDIGIGFGKSLEQNLELLAKLGKLSAEFATYPLLVGTSRKSFIGKLLGDVPVDRRLSGSLATATIAVWNGARIIRAHDVAETVEAVAIVNGLLRKR